MLTNISQLESAKIPPIIKSYSENDSEDDVEFNQLVHDLKSPVNSLKGIVNLAKRQIVDEQAKEYFYMINKCVSNLEEKISSALTMFRRGGDFSQYTEIDFEQLLKGIMFSLSHMNGFEQTCVNINIDNKRKFTSSPAILESVIQNLIENAIKYRCKSKPICEVDVVITDTHNGVQVEVKDNGIGIAEEKLPHIFESNFRAMMSDAEGHGIGLYLVEKAVEKINGTIKVTSKLGEGTTFTIDLPDAGNDPNYVGKQP